ncbi:hypothetical protein ACDI60_27110, partial [Klebsiella pneumoniae]|uniref:hypothetical protein n=1 Tax=Klebsiella pneumoniae TaxID=573 RepID=UPI003531C1C4
SFKIQRGMRLTQTDMQGKGCLATKLQRLRVLQKCKYYPIADAYWRFQRTIEALKAALPNPRQVSWWRILPMFNMGETFISGDFKRALMN